MARGHFAAGCFWGVEEAFAQQPGVTGTAVGYMGGTTPNPTYRQVCSGATGHAETVQVTFDPERISYDALLALFWQLHDPTQVNRQGRDRGTQYRSVLFVGDEEQRAAAEASRQALADSGRHRRRIATTIERAGDFWRAEDGHQQYLARHGLAQAAVPMRQEAGSTPTAATRLGTGIAALMNGFWTGLSGRRHREGEVGTASGEREVPEAPRTSKRPPAGGCSS